MSNIRPNEPQNRVERVRQCRSPRLGIRNRRGQYEEGTERCSRRVDQTGKKSGGWVVEGRTVVQEGNIHSFEGTR